MLLGGRPKLDALKAKLTGNHKSWALRVDGCGLRLAFFSRPTLTARARARVKFNIKMKRQTSYTPRRRVPPGGCEFFSDAGPKLSRDLRAGISYFRWTRDRVS